MSDSPIITHNGHTPALTATVPAVAWPQQVAPPTLGGGEDPRRPSAQPAPAAAPISDARAEARQQRIHLIKTEGKVVKVIVRCAYGMVLIVALIGQTTGVMNKLHLPWYIAGIAMLATEGLAVTFATVADYRRKLGERAAVAFTLATGFALFAVWVNWTGHADKSVFLAGFFAVFSGAGFIVYIVESAFRRRDQLWLAGKMDEPTPVYGLIQSIRHPIITALAKELARTDPSLGRTGSLAAAAKQLADEKRRAAIAAVVREDMNIAFGEKFAGLAVTAFDPDKLAAAIQDLADLDGMARNYAARIDPARLEAAARTTGSRRTKRAAAAQTPPSDRAVDTAQSDGGPRGQARAATGSTARTTSATTARVRAAHRAAEAPRGAWWTTARLEFYARSYAPILDEQGREIGGTDLAAGLGLDAGNARRARDQKLRDRYVQEVVDGARQPRAGLPEAIAQKIADRTAERASNARSAEQGTDRA